VIESLLEESSTGSMGANEECLLKGSLVVSDGNPVEIEVMCF